LFFYSCLVKRLNNSNKTSHNEREISYTTKHNHYHD
jgi:hypothetical protein